MKRPDGEWGGDQMRLVFMGTPKFAVPSLQALIAGGWDIRAVVTQPDRPRGRGQQVRYSPVKEIALPVNYGKLLLMS